MFASLLVGNGELRKWGKDTREEDMDFVDVLVKGEDPVPSLEVRPCESATQSTQFVKCHVQRAASRIAACPHYSIACLEYVNFKSGGTREFQIWWNARKPIVIMLACSMPL